MKRKIAPIWPLAMMALLICFLTVQISGAETSEYKWEKVSFKTPVAFSSPQKLGLDAVTLVHPPESGLGKGQMEITLVAVPKDMQESMGNKDAEIIELCQGHVSRLNPAGGKVGRTVFPGSEGRRGSAILQHPQAR